MYAWNYMNFDVRFHYSFEKRNSFQTDFSDQKRIFNFSTFRDYFRNAHSFYALSFTNIPRGKGYVFDTTSKVKYLGDR